jgi:hypothetical protein
MSALFAKLWRINKIFNRKFRRVQVTEASASYIVAGFVGSNLLLLSVWNIVAPLTYETFHVPDSTDNQQYASCSLSENKAAGWTLLVLVILVNFTSLVLACHEAFKARNISEQYSEAKGLGRALFSWVQIILVGVPVMLLLEGDNPSAKYFLEVILVLTMCLTLLLFMFVPIVLSLRREKLNPPQKRGSIRVSGLDLSASNLIGSTDGLSRELVGSNHVSNFASDPICKVSTRRRSSQSLDLSESDIIVSDESSPVQPIMPPVSESTNSEHDNIFVPPVPLPTTDERYGTRCSSLSANNDITSESEKDVVVGGVINDDIDPEQGQIVDTSDNNSTAQTSDTSEDGDGDKDKTITA